MPQSIMEIINKPNGHLQNAMESKTDCSFLLREGKWVSGVIVYIGTLEENYIELHSEESAHFIEMSNIIGWSYDFDY